MWDLDAGGMAELLHNNVGDDFSRDQTSHDGIEFDYIIEADICLLSYA